MPVLDLFSKRHKRTREPIRPELQYTELPLKFRVQVIYLIKEAFSGDPFPRYPISYGALYKHLHDGLAEHFGLHGLSEEHYYDPQAAIFTYLESCNWIDAIDVIEYVFRVFSNLERGYSDRNPDADGHQHRILSDLNERFREHELGYRFDGVDVIQVDSEFTYSEMIQPVRELLLDPIYKTANEEFATALLHHRHGDNKACLAECYKALESTLKIICEKRQWRSSGDKVSHLIHTCINRGLIPGFTVKYLDNVGKTLEAGIAPLRNATSGHGQGSEPIDVPDHLVRYGLNVTATAILLLVEADQALDGKASQI